MRPDILKIFDEANEFMLVAKYDDAINKFGKAIYLLPEPKNESEGYAELSGGLGDAYFFKKDFVKAADFFHDALNSPYGLDNPFIHLRLGQCYYEMGNFEKATDFLFKAYMLEGEEIFEDEERKYRQLIEKLI